MVANIGAVNSIFALVLKPEAGIKKEIIGMAAGINAESIKAQMGLAAVAAGVPVFIAIVGAQRAANINALLAIRTLPVQMGRGAGGLSAATEAKCQ